LCAVRLAPCHLLLLLLPACDISARSYVDPNALKAPRGLTYGRDSLELMVGEALRPLFPLVIGEIDAYMVSPPLPPGMVLDGRTGTIVGVPVRATVGTQHVVTAVNEFGRAEAKLSVSVSPAAFPFALLAQSGAERLSAFALQDGALLPTSTARTAGQPVAVANAAGFPVVASAGITALEWFVLDRQTALVNRLGALSLLAPVKDVVVNPNGRFVHAIHDGGVVTRALVDQRGRRLLAPALQQLGEDIVQIRFDPTGMLALAVDRRLLRITLFAADIDFGMLRPLLATSVPAAPGAVAVDLANAQAIVGYPASGELVAYGFTSTSVVERQRTPLGAAPAQLELDASGHLLLAACERPDLLLAFRLGLDGLTAAGRIELPSRPTALAVQGAHAYVSTADGLVITLADPVSGKLTQQAFDRVLAGASRVVFAK
jgi:hypothetical protein